MSLVVLAASLWGAVALRSLMIGSGINRRPGAVVLSPRRRMVAVAGRSADDPEESEDRGLLDDDGDLGGGLGGDLEDDEPLLIDDVEAEELSDMEDEENDEEGDEEGDDDDLDDLLIESDQTDSLADLLRMGHRSTSVESSSLQDEWQRRELALNETNMREAAAAEKRRQRSEALAEFERERGIGFLVEDPICRAIVVCVTTGSPADCERVTALESELKHNLGDLIELVHNPDPDPDPDFPFFEVWIEGYRFRLLHARNWQGDGDLTDDHIHNIVAVVKEEVSDDAGDVVATYPDDRD